MVYFVEEIGFPQIGCDNFRKNMEKYDLLISNIASLEDKLSEDGITEERKKCYQFHLSRLKVRLREVQRTIQF